MMWATTMPTVALSIRQPWAWAIVQGYKDIENRSTFAVSKANFDVRPVAIHAAKGMTIEEYEALAFTPGIYRVRRQREATPEGWQRAQD